MFFGINEIAVVVTALLGMALGSIWYSPLLFGKAWMKASGMTESQLEQDRPDMVRSLLFTGTALVLLMFVLAHIANWAMVLELRLLTVSGYLALIGMVVISLVSVLERKSLSYAAVHAGYVAIVIVAGMYVISYWPW